MATTKRRSTSKTSRATSARRSASQRMIDLPDTGDMMRSVRARPKTSAALAAGLLTGLAAGVAGYLAFKRSGKTWEEFSDDVATSVKDSASAARTRIQDGIDEVKARAKDWSEPRKDGLSEEKSQAMFAEEALTLKETGKKTKRPVDDTVATELKAGAVSY